MGLPSCLTTNTWVGSAPSTRGPYFASTLARSGRSFHQTATCGAASHSRSNGKSDRSSSRNEMDACIQVELPTNLSLAILNCLTVASTGSMPMRNATSCLTFTIRGPATIQLMPRSLPEDIVRMVAHHPELGSAARVAPCWRSWRSMVDCPDRIAWIAEDDEAWARLRRE